MSQWLRFSKSTNRGLYYITHILLMLIVIAFIAKLLFTMFIFISCLIIFLLHSYYFTIAGNGLDLLKVKEKTFLIIDDQGKWKITIINKGMPIIKASLIVTFDQSVLPAGIPYRINHGLVEIKIPFFIRKNEEKEISIPIVANKRGKSQIRELTVRIPHLYGSGYVDLTYQSLIHSQILVYPQRNPVNLSDLVFKNKQGLQDVRASLFVDTMHPIGVRNYIAGDPFQHIHWKASAKMQNLQTKVFSPIASRGWLVIMNISEHYSINARLEEMISQAAFIIDYALKEEIPFSLAANVRSFGSTPFYYLLEGSGPMHRQAAFEFLTVLSFSSLLFPPLQMLSQLKNEELPSVITFLGSETIEIQEALQDIASAGRTIYGVNNKGVLKQWKQKNMAV